MASVPLHQAFSAPPGFGERCRLFIDDFLRPNVIHMETGVAYDRLTDKNMLMIGVEGRPHVFTVGEAHILIRTLKVMKPKDDPVEGRAVKELIRRIKKAVHKMEKKHF